MNKDLLESQQELLSILKLPELEEKAVTVMIARAYSDGLLEGMARARRIVLSRKENSGN